MKSKEPEVKPTMTNAQTKALLEAIKIITEQVKDPEEIKNALDRIQSALEPRQ